MGARRTPLILMTADTVGGVWHYAVELAEALGARGVRVALATMGSALTASQRAQISRVRTASVHESVCKLEWMQDPWVDVVRAGAWLLRLEQALHPDVVHLNQFAFGALPFEAPTLVVAHSCVISWYRGVQGTDAPREWNRYREAVRSGLTAASALAAPTQAVLQTFYPNYGVAREGVVIPNGRAAARYLPNRKQPLILAAGRLWDAAKNLAALEAVAADIAWPILVAGSNSHPDGGVRELGGVRALGELAPDALAQQFARAAIYALPARYEPFGLSVLEAALAGCVLVLGDIPSLREVWGEAALFVPPDDHAALRGCLTRLIGEASLRQRLARAARARALAYTAERMAGAYLALYSALSRTRAVPDDSARVFPSEVPACTS